MGLGGQMRDLAGVLEEAGADRLASERQRRAGAVRQAKKRVATERARVATGAAQAHERHASVSMMLGEFAHQLAADSAAWDRDRMTAERRRQVKAAREARARVASDRARVAAGAADARARHAEVADLAGAWREHVAVMGGRA